jgi:hypothetical protein
MGAKLLFAWGKWRPKICGNYSVLAAGHLNGLRIDGCALSAKILVARRSDFFQN